MYELDDISWEGYSSIQESASGTGHADNKPPTMYLQDTRTDHKTPDPATTKREHNRVSCLNTSSLKIDNETLVKSLNCCHVARLMGHLACSQL